MSCNFDLDVSKRSSTTVYTDALEQRTRHLDAQVAGLRAELEQTMRQLNQVGHQVGQNNKSPSVPASHPAVSREFGRMIQIVGHGSKWRGNSSGIYFVDAALVSLQASLGRHAMLESDVFGTLPQSTTPTSNIDEARDSALPPMQLAMDLTSLYFDYVNQMIPVLHRGTFLETLTAMYEGENEAISDTYTPLFYHVMAIGFHLQKVINRMDASNHWRASPRQRRAHESRPEDLETLQLYVVEMLALCLEKDPWHAVQLCGQATRLALSLGLHRHSQRFQRGPLETEMRKRVFWSVLTVDT